MRNKLTLVLFFIWATLLFAWIGSDLIVRLIWPKSVHYTPDLGWNLRDTPVTWQKYGVPHGGYGIVYNEIQGVDRWEYILLDVTTGETTYIGGDDTGTNTNIYQKISGSGLAKKPMFIAGHTYVMKLIAYDMNGNSKEDTAIVTPIQSNYFGIR